MRTRTTLLSLGGFLSGMEIKSVREAMVKEVKVTSNSSKIAVGMYDPSLKS